MKPNSQGYFPFISKEGRYFVICACNAETPKLYLNTIEMKRLKKKMNEIDIDKFFWKLEI